MATVTGFTAERMLEIENTTVVDGEIQGDNLILMTREGTPIDAGNVRGPQGTQGPPGPVPSVNDQTGAVYAPRIFPSKTALDSNWAAAPLGAMAFTTDSETIWTKNASGWIVSNPERIFASNADRDTRWPAPPEGAKAITVDGDVEWYKAPAGWNVSNGVRVFGSASERDTRWPTPPYGAMCVLADTRAVQEYGSFGWTPPWNTSWGSVCPVNIIPDGLFVGSEWVNVAVITLPAWPTGRMIHVMSNHNVYITVQGTSLHYQLFWSGNSQSIQNPLYANGPVGVGTSWVATGCAPIPSMASATTITLRGICPAGLAGTSGPNRLWAVDAGPLL